MAGNWYLAAIGNKQQLLVEANTRHPIRQRSSSNKIEASFPWRERGKYSKEWRKIAFATAAIAILISP